MLLGLNPDCVPLGLGPGLGMDVIILATSLRVIIRELDGVRSALRPVQLVQMVGPELAGEQEYGPCPFYLHPDAESIPLSLPHPGSDTG